jgi:hypothetical protein
MLEGRLSKNVARLTKELIGRLERAIEVETSRRAQTLVETYRRKTASRPLGSTLLGAAVLSANEAEPSPVAQPGLGPEPGVTRPPQPRPRRRRQAPTGAFAPPPPPRDPEEQRRAVELARLRAILRPTAPAPAPVTAPAPLVPPPRPDSSEGSLQALEDQIRERIPTLSGLSQRRCTAQIAAWVGRVRRHQHEHEPDRARLASRILLDKLRNLAWSMEAGTIEGLDLSWSTRHWQRYVEANELIAATPDPVPEPERQADTQAAIDDASVWALP